MNIKFEYITDNELHQVARLHKNNIDQGFLSTLGSGFLFYLYKAIRDCDTGLLILALDDCSVIGFISGTTHLKSIYKVVLREYFIQIIFSIIPHLLSFSNIKKLFDTFFYSSRSDLHLNLPDSELLSMAVNPSFRGKSVAKQLFESLKDEFIKRQINQFKIVAGSDLIRARTFYEKMGAIEQSQIEVHSGSQSIVYIMNINN